MRPLVLRSLMTAFAFLATTVVSNAAWLNAYTGNTIMGQPTVATDGVVNFGVYERAAGTIFANDGQLANVATQLAAAGADASAKYIYFYSVVNTKGPNSPQANSADPSLISLYVQTNGTQTSVGALASAAFTDNQTLPTSAGPTGQRLVGSFVPGSPNPTLPGPTSNQLLGNNTAINANDGVPLDGAPTYTIDQEANVPTIGLRSAAPGTVASQTNPITTTYTPPPTSDPLFGNPSLRFTFVLPTNGFSTLVFFTSNALPGFGSGVISSGPLANSGGDVPVPTPEPATLALLSMAVPMFGFGYARRRRGQTGPGVAV